VTPLVTAKSRFGKKQKIFLLVGNQIGLNQPDFLAILLVLDNPSKIPVSLKS